MRNIRLIVEYDGSAYHGWQVQKNGISVQQQLGLAIGTITGVVCLPVGAGRTDAGVHAAGQVACFQTRSAIPAERFATALNAVLPRSISIRRSEEVPLSFHPRKDALRKHYRYLVLNRSQRSALMAERAWHVSKPLNLVDMQDAATQFVGTHHFGAFCASGHSVKTFERTVLHSAWTDLGDGLLAYDVQGTGFLYNMVRILVGTMVEVGMGKRQSDSIGDLLLCGDRRLAGKTAPACGLCMMSVYYDSVP